MSARPRQLSATSWIPATRFMPPVVGEDLVLDEEVVDAVADAMSCSRLTTLIGPAGAGKSTLMASALQRLPRHHARGWIRLDATDDDARTLVELIVVGATLAAGIEDAISRQLVDAADDVSPSRLLGILLNDLAATGQPLTLVLDDVHHLNDEDSAELLDFLIRHAHHSLHLAVAGRRQPVLSVARLRAGGECVEFGEHVLRFDPDRASRLLEQRLGQDLDRAELDELVAHSAGWVAALLLQAGRATEDRRPVGDDIDQLLADEVIANETPEIQRFLMATSVLDVLSADPCAAVSGQADSGRILRGLRDRLGLFLIDHGDQYRYHDLLRDHLQEQLAGHPELSREAHVAAARLQEGPSRIDHLLLAGDHEAAATEIVAFGREWVAREVLAPRISSWISRLDESVSGNNPWIGLLDGAARATLGDLAGAARVLDPLTSLETDDFEFEWLLTRYLHFATHDHRRFAPTWARLLSDPRYDGLPAAHRVGHHIGAAWGAFWIGRHDEAAQKVRAAVAVTREERDLASAQALTMHYIPLLTSWPGGVHDAIEHHSWALSTFAEESIAVRLRSEALLAVTRLVAGEPWVEPPRVHAVRLREDAVIHSARLADLRVRGHDAGVAAEHAHAPALTDVEDAMEVTARSLSLGIVAGALADRSDVGGLDDLHSAWRASMHRQVGAPSATKQLTALIESCRARVAGDLDSAEQILQDGVGAAAELPIALSNDVRVELAILRHERGRKAEAQAVLAPVLDEVSASGALLRVALSGIRVLPVLTAVRGRGRDTAQQVAAILEGAAAEPTPALPIPGSVETLTGREVEILRELATGAGNADIAERLFISTNTVKTHVKRVLHKLEVSSRAAAVARGRELHLI